VASALSGLHPLVHGVTSEYSEISGCRLLGEYLKPEGYATAAFVANPWITAEWGFDAGFDLFEEADGWDAARADQITDRVLDHVAASPQRPFFIFVHTIDPHHPYDAPGEYADLWPLTKSRTLAEMDPLLVTSEASAELIDDMVRAYDAEIRFNDAQFGRLLDGLRELGLYRDALIVFLSDHGEEFHDHGGTHHGSTLYEEVVRVALAVKLPGDASAGTRYRAPASIMDIVPTTLSYLDVSHDELDGIDLLDRLVAPPLSAEERNLFFHLNMEKPDPTGVSQRHVARAVLAGSYKYVDVVSPERGKGQMLFDLSSDPHETENLVTRSPRLAAGLGQLVDEAGPAFDAVVQLRIASAARQSITGEITTDGQIYGLRFSESEWSNEVKLSDDRRALEFRIKGQAASDRRSRQGPFGEHEGLSFRVDPPGARLTVARLSWEHNGPSLLFAGPDLSEVSDFPWTVSAGASHLLATAPRALVSESSGLLDGVYLTTSDPFERQWPDEIPDELRRRLKSLGYLGD
jgi:arylsulfatase A-like enzyme